MTRRSIIIVCVVVVALLLLLVGIYFGYLWYTRHHIKPDTSIDVPQNNNDMSYTEKDYRGTNNVWGIRNNNPGNIRPGDPWKGTDPDQPSDGGFVRFISMKWGIRAAIKNLASEINTYGSIENYMYHYAPPSENNTEAYIAQVCKATGFDRKDVPALNADNLISLCWAHFAVEDGGIDKIKQFIDDSDMEAAVAETPYKRTFLG